MTGDPRDQEEVVTDEREKEACELDKNGMVLGKVMESPDILIVVHVPLSVELRYVVLIELKVKASEAGKDDEMTTEELTSKELVVATVPHGPLILEPRKDEVTKVRE